MLAKSLSISIKKKKNFKGFAGGSAVKNPSASAGDLGSIPGQGDPLEEDMATGSSVLAWRTLWTEEAGGLQSMGSQRVRHDSAAKQEHKI